MSPEYTVCNTLEPSASNLAQCQPTDKDINNNIDCNISDDTSHLQSSLPIPPILGLAKNLRYSGTAVLGGSITFIKNPI